MPDLLRRVPFLRDAMHGWFLLSRGMTLGVRAVAIDQEDRVCLVRQTYTAGWGLPGGGVELGETALDALARELVEEAAIAVTGAPELHGVFFNRRVSRRDHVLVYVVRGFRVLGPKRPDLEIAEARFFPLAELPADATRATRARLAEIAGDRPVNPDW